MGVSNQISVGLDIGTSKVCGVAASMKENGKLEILAIAKELNEGVEDGVVTNIDKTSQAISKVIAELERQANVEINAVFNNINGRTTRLKVQNLRHTVAANDGVITYNDVKSLHQAIESHPQTPPAHAHIAVYPRYFQVDAQAGLYDPIGRTGNSINGEYNVVYSAINVINNINQALRRSGISPDQHSNVANSIASAMSTLYSEEMETGVCLIDFGAGCITMALFCNHILLDINVIPLGGNIITKDIAEGCNILLSQAEQVKVRFGKAIPDNVGDDEWVSIPGIKGRKEKLVKVANICKIIQARVAELAELIDVDLEKSSYSSHLKAGIVLTGGVANLQGVKEILEACTGKEVRVGLPTEHLDKIKLEQVKNPEYATAVGLALCGFRGLEQRFVRHESIEDEEQPSKENLISRTLSGGSGTKLNIKTKVTSWLDRIAGIKEEDR